MQQCKLIKGASAHGTGTKFKELLQRKKYGLTQSMNLIIHELTNYKTARKKKIENRSFLPPLNTSPILC